MVIGGLGPSNFSPPWAYQGEYMPLKVPGQISVWLENEAGFIKYNENHNNPGYFLHYETVNDAEANTKLLQGLDFLKAKLAGQDVTKPYGFVFVKKFDGEKAGAAYLYPEDELQNDQDIAELEANLIITCQDWATANGYVFNEPKYNVGDFKYLVITMQGP